MSTEPTSTDLSEVLNAALRSGIAHNNGAGGQYLLCATEAQLLRFAAAVAQDRAARAQAEPVAANVDAMVNQFLGWPLPKTFNPDCGISFKRTHSENGPFGPQRYEPTGTNLFTADEARAMFTHALAAAPTSPKAAVGAVRLPDVSELLEALIECHHQLECLREARDSDYARPDDSTIEQARAAIAKATGEQA